MLGVIQLISHKIALMNTYSSTGRKSTALFPDDSDVFLDDCYIFPSETRKKYTIRGKTFEFEGNKAGFRPVDT